MNRKLFLSLTLILAATATSTAFADPAALAQSKGCLGCHDLKVKKVGPAYAKVAEKYKGHADAVAKVIASIKAGGSGKWGKIPMPPQSTLTDDELKTLANWILSQ